MSTHDKGRLYLEQREARRSYSLNKQRMEARPYKHSPVRQPAKAISICILCGEELPSVYCNSRAYTHYGFLCFTCYLQEEAKAKAKAEREAKVKSLTVGQGSSSLST